MSDYNDRALALARANHPYYRSYAELEAHVDAFCRGDDEGADRIDREARERIMRALPVTEVVVSQATRGGTT